MKKLMLAVLALGMTGAAFAARELDEKMSELEWSSEYKPVKDAAVKARDEGQFLDAAAKFEKAGDATAFKVVRAQHLQNVALCYLLAAEAALGERDGQGKGRNAKELLGKALVYNAEARSMADEAESGHSVDMDKLLLGIEQCRGAAQSRLDKIDKGGKR